MNIQVLFDLMSDVAAYHAHVAATVPCKLWVNSSDMFTAVAANGNTVNSPQKLANQFKNNRNEMLYEDHAAMALQNDHQKKSVMTYLFTDSTRAMVTLPARESFVLNADLGQKPLDKMPEGYQYEDTHEAILEDVTPTNIIQFVPRHLRRTS